MQHSPRPLPGWFRAIFVTVMLLLCFFLCWQAVQQVQLHFQLDDLTISLDTSRQREAKQRFEYDEVSRTLPETEAALAALLPETEAAQAREADLRAERKSLRQRQAELTQQIADLQAETDALAAQASALQAEVDALLARAAELQAD